MDIYQKLRDTDNAHRAAISEYMNMVESGKIPSIQYGSMEEFLEAMNE